MMTDRVRRALSALEERATAVAGGGPDDPESVHWFDASEVGAATRALLHGYVAAEDYEGIEEFLHTMYMAVVLTIARNPSEEGAGEGACFALAQVFLAGQLYGLDGQ